MASLLPVFLLVILIWWPAAPSRPSTFVAPLHKRTPLTGMDMASCQMKLFGFERRRAGKRLAADGSDKKHPPAWEAAFLRQLPKA